VRFLSVVVFVVGTYTVYHANASRVYMCRGVTVWRVALVVAVWPRFRAYSVG